MSHPDTHTHPHAIARTRAPVARIPSRGRAPFARLSAGCALMLALACAGAAQAALRAPHATTEKATAVTASTATLNATVDPNGEPTEYFFQYGPTRKFGLATPAQSAGNGKAPLHVSIPLSGLAAFTTYYFRVVATSPARAVLGGAMTFTTAKVPLSITISASPNPVSYGGAYIVKGTVSGTGAAGQTVMLQANPFPYLAGFQQLGNEEVTTAAGTFSFPVLNALLNTQLRVLTGKPLIVSATLVQQVAVKVTLHARATRRRGYVRFSGTVQPAEPGAKVGFQLLRRGRRSLNIGGASARGETAAGSRFARVVRARRGNYVALVRITADGAHVSGTSVPVFVR